MKTSFSNRVLYLAWKLGVSLVEHLYVHPSRWVVRVYSSLVALWPIGCALAAAFVVLLAVSGVRWAYTMSNAVYSGDGWLWGVCMSVVFLALIILSFLVSVKIMGYLCSPFARFENATERQRLVLLLERAYPGAELPICCSTKLEAWLVAYLFDDTRTAQHRQRALEVQLPAPSPPSNTKTRF